MTWRQFRKPDRVDRSIIGPRNNNKTQRREFDGNKEKNQLFLWYEFYWLSTLDGPIREIHSECPGKKTWRGNIRQPWFRNFECAKFFIICEIAQNLHGRRQKLNNSRRWLPEEIWKFENWLMPDYYLLLDEFIAFVQKPLKILH